MKEVVGGAIAVDPTKPRWDSYCNSGYEMLNKKALYVLTQKIFFHAAHSKLNVCYLGQP